MLKLKAERVARKVMNLSESDDFRLSLQHWYDMLPAQAKNSVLSTDLQNMLISIRDVAIGNGSEIIENLAKAATNFFIEDWTDKTILEFEDMLQSLIDELENKKNASKSSSSKILLTTDTGVKECFYDFDPESLSSSGFFFQSALDDMVDEYGAVDNNEKIGILMSMVKKLMGE